MKCLYLVTRSLDPTGQGRARWTTRWKPALNVRGFTTRGVNAAFSALRA